MDTPPGCHRGDLASIVGHTFADLKSERRKHAASGQVGKNELASSLTALSAFMAAFDRTDHDPFHPLLGEPNDDFAARLRQFEAKAKVSRGTFPGYQSRLRKWNEIAARLTDRFQMEPVLLCDVLSSAIRTYQLKNSESSDTSLAKAAGVSNGLLNVWKLGTRRPKLSPGNLVAAHNLEEILGLIPDTLAGLLTRPSPFKGRTTFHEESKARRNKFQLNSVRIRPTDLPSKLAEFFERYFVHKSTAVALFDAAGVPLQSPRTTWRVTVSKTGKRSTVTGAIVMERVLSMIGWLTLPTTTQGALRYILENRHSCSQPITDDVESHAPLFIGKGLQLEEITPAHLVDPDLLGEFLEWQKKRSGFAPGDILLFAAALLAPHYGFLSQQVEYVWDYHKLGIRSVDMTTDEDGQKYVDCSKQWAVKCDIWLKRIRGLFSFVKRKESLKRAYKQLRPLIEHPDPMSFVNRIIQAHASVRPVGKLEIGYTGASGLAIWHRDQLLLRMLAANPLRNRNFREMRYRENPTPEDKGNLYRTKTGGWRLCFEPADFKNQIGAASEPYDVEVPPELWPLIETYLVAARPILLRGGNYDEVFLTRTGKPFDVISLSTQVWSLTGRYLDGAEDVYGFRTHAFRHLVATAWLKAHPEDYLTVAHILHDTLPTVLKHYAHNKPNEGLKRYNGWLRTRIEPLRLNPPVATVLPPPRKSLSA